MKKIAITGPNGLVGSRIIELLKNDFEFIPLSHKDIDITDKELVAEQLKSIDFDILLHLAAYTNVEGAETDRSQAYLINVDGTSNIFHALENTNKKIIYISTDFVFDGTNPPYDENSKPNPLGYYALTKFNGEKVLQNTAMIVRIGFPYGNIKSVKPDFIMRVKQLLEEGKTLNMITNSTITPTYIDDIAFALKHLMDNYSPEIFHIVGSKSYSPFETGKLIAKTFGLDEKLVREISYEEYSKDKAPRPQFSEIISIKNTFQKMKNLEEGLNELKKQVRV
ncbi:MAG TPA: NAD(P)-dependent oxidoreductase [Candidatus Woesebacteria bacterium]|nr:NAD(P)-dependent oxidoreductase [Candidatus Woesebacteria bacterium]